MGNGNKVVWILGAGFSKSLGAPLMNELFSARFMSDVGINFSHVPELTTGAALYPARIYERGARADLLLWSNVEQFADNVCEATANESGAPATRLRKLADELRADDEPRLESIAALHGATTCLIAAQCCSFLRDQNKDKSEKWLPFTEWARTLGTDDSIVTFNYDRVLEYLKPNMRVMLPRDILADIPMWDMGSIYKLHGSVDWRDDAREKAILVDHNAEFAVSCADEERVIATPGPAKYEASNGKLQPIWRAAMTKIRDADAVVFIGYRMPDSDTFAEKKILDALHENMSQHCHIHLVLHHDRDAQQRLTQLIDMKVPQMGRRVAGLDPNPNRVLLRYWTREHAPLGAREFLTWERQKLFAH